MKIFLILILLCLAIITNAQPTNRRSDTIQFNPGGSDALKLFNGINTQPLTNAPAYLVINGQVIAGSVHSSNNRWAFQGFSYSGRGGSFTSTTGTGSYGYSLFSYGNFGDTGSGVGSLGNASSGIGVEGLSGTGIAGVFDIANLNTSNILEVRRNSVTKGSLDKDGIYSLTGIYKMPATAGTAGQILSSNGTGAQLSWITNPIRDSIQANAAYGERHLLVGGVETITTPSTNTNYNVTQYTATTISKDINAASNGGLQVTTKGTYLAYYNVKIETGKINAVGVSVNGTRNNDSETDVFNYSGYVSGQKILNLKANDVVRMTITTDSQTQVGITLKGSFLVLRKLIN
jgi:hypothetical protein